MFELAMPWWEFAIRGAICYLGVLLLLRLTGKRAFADMSSFDIVVLIIIGGMLRPAVTGDDHSLLGPFISIVTILALDKLLSKLSAVLPIVELLLEGRAVLLARDGAMCAGVLVRHSISEAAFLRELRAHGVDAVEKTESVHLEANGHVTVLEKKP